MSILELGNNLYHILTNAQLAIFKIGELIQLSSESYNSTINGINISDESEIKLAYPIGIDHQGKIIPFTVKYTKDDLIKHFNFLKDTQLPLIAIYQLITQIEVLFNDLLSEVILTYPKKLGEKKTIPISVILANKTLQGVHISAIDAYLNELNYKSPREYGESIEKILSINLIDLPSYQKFVEIKATRDIHIHSKGIANEIYIEKSLTHARVNIGQVLPVDINYFLQSYESCLQIIEHFIEKLNENWPSTLKSSKGDENDKPPEPMKGSSPS